MAEFEHLDPALPVSARTSAIFSETRRLIEVAAMEAGLFVGITAGLGVVIDLTGSQSSMVVNIASIALGFLFVSAALRKGGLAPNGLQNGFGTYFGISLLAGLATILGLVLLIVPGIVLLVRWSSAFGHGLADGDRVTEALGASWRATGPHFWPILLALLLPAVIMLIGLAAYAFADFGLDPAQIASVVAGNGLLMAGSLLSTAVGMAVYSLTTRDNAGLQQVFE